jgi:uncharacterized RDD family membrane protein YckC
LETPEGIDLEVSPAGPVPRGLAIMVDGVITQTGTLVIGLLLGLAGNAGVGIYLLLLFLVEWFYPVLFEVLRGGQTPGKKAFSLRVVNADATPICWNASLLRNLLRVVDVFPVFYLAGVTSMVLSGRFQRLGDLAAHTLVVHTHAREAAAEEVTIFGANDLGARPAAVSLAAADQRALLGYAERQAELSLERAIELSDILEPLTSHRGEEGRLELIRIANGIAGRT